MNTLQRLLSNTFLAYLGTVIVKASSSLLFIFIGRRLGPENAGIFNLAVTYFTVTLALSAWGLHELLVREVAARRDESGRYLVNYLFLRVLLTGGAYLILLGLLAYVLPYSAQLSQVIRILSLAVFPEAIFALCQALFVAHERLLAPTLAALVNSGFKFGAGYWLLVQGQPVETIAWVMPLGSALSLLVFGPALLRLLRQVPQRVNARLSFQFSREQLRFTPGFILIGIFSTMDFQLDAFLISLLLSEADIGWYGAAQTIVLGFWMMPVAIRTAIYPLMARYYKEDPARLVLLYRRANQYLLLVVLPIAAGITLLAGPIIRLVYNEGFEPSVAALQIMIWAVLFAFLNVPNARLILVYNHQKQAGLITGLSMLTNLLLNVLLIPRYGIAGAAFSRVGASAAVYFLLYAYAQRRLLAESILPLLPRPLLAVLLMTAAVWPLRELFLLWPILVGTAVYALAALLLGAVPADARAYLRQLVTFAPRS